MGSKRSARRKKNAHLATARPPTAARAREPAKGEGTSDVLLEPFFRADSLAPAELDARVAPDAEAHFAERRTWSPEAKARRARFGRYVAMTLGACAVVCALAGVRHATMARSSGPVVKPATALRPPPPLPTAPPTPPADEIAPANDAVPPEDRFVESAENDRDVARREKRESQRALELGHVGEAIALGEKSVAVDPTDREAWLILGAAYQHSNAPDDARRCFQACIAQGKRGATWECAAMLR
jgi:tetratricopeptide (TPR) repeat protein